MGSILRYFSRVDRVMWVLASGVWGGNAYMDERNEV